MLIRETPQTRYDLMLSTTVLDFNDDNGSLLRDIFNTASQVPDFVKSASVVSQDEPANRFALVLSSDSGVRKAYPISDPGNTYLSSVYYSSTHSALPLEAQKVAAANILKACRHYGLPPTQVVEKIAALSSSADEDALVVEGGESPLPTVADRGDPIHFAVERADGTSSYPLDNAGLALLADQYFEQNHGRFNLRERREYAVKTAAALNRGGLPVGSAIEAYSGDSYSGAVEGWMSVRLRSLRETGDGEALALMTKLSVARESIDPDSFASLLEKADRATGLDRQYGRGIPDAYKTVFHQVKTAEDGIAAGLQSGASVSVEGSVDRLVQNHPAKGRELLGEAALKGLRKNPKQVFDSLPKPEQILLLRLANSQQDG